MPLNNFIDSQLDIIPSLSYTASFGFETRTVDINPVSGAGSVSTWHLFVDRYYAAAVDLIAGKICVHPGPGTWMTGDDMGAVADVMEDEGLADAR